MTINRALVLVREMLQHKSHVRTIHADFPSTWLVTEERREALQMAIRALEKANPKLVDPTLIEILTEPDPLALPAPMEK